MFGVCKVLPKPPDNVLSSSGFFPNANVVDPVLLALPNSEPEGLPAVAPVAELLWAEVCWPNKAPGADEVAPRLPNRLPMDGGAVLVLDPKSPPLVPVVAPKRPDPPPPPEVLDPKLKLIVARLQTERPCRPMCPTATANWMGAGCNALESKS